MGWPLMEYMEGYWTLRSAICIMTFAWLPWEAFLAFDFNLASAFSGLYGVESVACLVLSSAVHT